MRKKVLLILLIVVAGLEMSARKQIDIQHNGQLPGHTEYPVYVDDPHQGQFEAYYDNDMQMIFFEGTGEIDFYYVDIISMSTMSILLHTTVNGDYDAISMSSYTDGKYLLVVRLPSQLLLTTLLFDKTSLTTTHPISIF